MSTKFNNNIAIKVAVRLRNDDQDTCKENYINSSDRELHFSRKDGSNLSFTYDYIFDHKVNQDNVYNVAVKPLIAQFIDGYNATIFAYGQTDSGKTYTIGSSKNATSLDNQNEGIIPHCLNDLFSSVDLTNFELSMSLLEIDQSSLIDLFKNDKKNLIIQNFSVKDLKKCIIVDLKSSIDLLKKGFALRKVDKTNMNRESSRTHLVFTIYLENKKSCNVSKLNIIDLAGTEKPGANYKSSDNKKLLIQGSSINNSLMQLKLLIKNLSKGITNVSYSANNLTKILKDSLGGNSYSLLIACLNTKSSCYSETFDTLEFANMIKFIKNKPQKLITEKSVMIEEKLIEELRLLRELKDEYERVIRKRKITTSDRSTSPIRFESSELEKITHLNSVLKNPLRELKDERFTSIGLKFFLENEFLSFKHSLLRKCFLILDNSLQFSSCHQFRETKKGFNILIRCRKFYEKKEKCLSRINFDYIKKDDSLEVVSSGRCDHYILYEDINNDNKKKRLLL